jgi:diacylglycerol kinase (ATP)
LTLNYNPDDSMRKAALLYNPLSGRRRGRRLEDVEIVLGVLRDAKVEISVAATRSAKDATEQTRQAVAEGCEAVFACGGDGTVHDVLQGLVGTSIALGIIPLGTGNALAHDLRLPLSPADAARALLSATPKRIAVGEVTYQNFSGERGSKYFTVALGIGVDAHLFYKLNPLMKLRLGMGAYYAQATRLWLTHNMDYFRVELPDKDSQQTRQTEVSQLLAIRIRDFGGPLHELAPGASLERDDLRLVLFHTRSRFAYVRYVMQGFLGMTRNVKGIELVDSAEAICRQLANHQESPRILVQADGELLGTLPAEISMVPNAVTLLVPEQGQDKS